MASSWVPRLSFFSTNSAKPPILKETPDSTPRDIKFIEHPGPIISYFENGRKIELELQDSDIRGWQQRYSEADSGPMSAIKKTCEKFKTHLTNTKQNSLPAFHLDKVLDKFENELYFYDNEEQETKEKLNNLLSDFYSFTLQHENKIYILQLLCIFLAKSHHTLLQKVFLDKLIQHAQEIQNKKTPEINAQIKEKLQEFIKTFENKDHYSQLEVALVDADWDLIN